MPVFSTKIFLFALACASLALVVAQSCPAGQEFVDNACQDCPPGEFKNAPGEGACAPCPAGSFTSVSGSTNCCSCCAGFYAEAAGATACISCGGGVTSPVGATAFAQCGTGGGTATDSCSIDGRTCPATTADGPTGGELRRRRLVSNDACPRSNERMCNGKCIDVHSNMWHCGGCSDHNDMYGKRGTDCSYLPNANEVSCQVGQCVISSCRDGFTPSLSKRSCMWKRSRRSTSARSF